MNAANPLQILGTYVSRTCALPKEWIKAVQKMNLWDKMVEAPMKGGDRDAVWRLHINGFIKMIYDEDYSVFYPEEAFEICRLYLETIDRNQWPILMGMNPMMDRALEQSFKRGSAQKVAEKC